MVIIIIRDDPIIWSCNAIFISFIAYFIKSKIWTLWSKFTTIKDLGRDVSRLGSTVRRFAWNVLVVAHTHMEISRRWVWIMFYVWRLHRDIASLFSWMADGKHISRISTHCRFAPGWEYIQNTKASYRFEHIHTFFSSSYFIPTFVYHALKFLLGQK